MYDWHWKEEYRFSTSVYIVYGVEIEQKGLYKIGASGNIERRFKELERQYGLIYPIHIFHACGLAFEKKLHRLFANKKQPVQGCHEWFALDKDDIEQIKKINPKDCSQ